MLNRKRDEAEEMKAFLSQWPEICNNAKFPAEWASVEKIKKLRNIEAETNNRQVVKIWLHRRAVALYRTETRDKWHGDGKV